MPAGSERRLTPLQSMKGQIELPIFGDYVGEIIKHIRLVAGNNKLCLRFSGGKDSVVTKFILDQAGVDYEYRFSRTSVDPPELRRFICKYYPDVLVEKNRTTMFNMIIKKGFPPTRVCRYCCKEFKERNTCPKGDVLTVTGVRNSESRNRSTRNRIETCLAYKNVTFYHPIIKMSEDQVWKVIIDNHLPYCELYDQGFDRIGCVGCPLSSSKKIKKEFRRWPNYEKAYLWAFDKMLEGRHFDKWKNKYDVMEWYIYGVQKKYQEIEGQAEYEIYDRTLYLGDYYEEKPGFELYDTVEQAKTLLLN